MSLTDQLNKTFFNASGSVLAQGTIIRATSGVNQATTAFSSTSEGVANVAGVMSSLRAGLGSAFQAQIDGETQVLMETGLTPVAGQLVFVSASVAGRGTNVAPGSNPAYVGYITDVSKYARLGLVTVVLQLASAISQGGANWGPAVVRYFLADYTNGNDGNTGYVDAAAGTVFTPATIQAFAVKTIQRLQQIIPRQGNGLQTVVLVRGNPDGTAQITYYRQDGVTIDWIDRNGYSGYSTMIWRVSDFTNSTADKLRCGTQQDPNAIGPNSDESWTVQSFTAPVITVAAGVLPTTLATIEGKCFEPVGNVTAALAAKGGIIKRVRSATTVEVGIGSTNTQTSPAASDTFFIRRPSVIIADIIGTDTNAVTPATSASATLVGGTVVSGFDMAGWAGSLFSKWNGNGLVMTKCLLRQTTIRMNTGTGIAFGGMYLNESGAVVECGHTFGMIGSGTASSISITGPLGYSTNSTCPLQCLVVVNTGTVSAQIALRVGLAGSNQSSLLSRSAVFGSIIVNDYGNYQPLTQACLGGKANDYDRLMLRAATSVTNAGIQTDCRSLTIGNTIIGNYSGATSSAIQLFGNCAAVRLVNVTQDTEANALGIDLASANGCDNAIVCVDSTCTVTGSTGDIRLSGPAFTTIAGLAITNVVDNRGNNVYGSGGRVVDVCKLVSNQAGSALAICDAVKSNGTTNQVAGAQATSAAAYNSDVAGVMVTPPASAALGYMAIGGTPWVEFDAAPALGVTNGIAYLSPGTIRRLTTTIPIVAANANKLRVGKIIDVSGTRARVAWHPENLAVLADGLA